MKVTGPWLSDPATQEWLLAMENCGYLAYFVGGCVRNALMQRPVQDVDLATSAKPEIVTDIAERIGFKVIPTGLDHGTVTLLAQQTRLEVTTFRRDVATDGRHATIAYSTSIEDDAQRRDFTMNALFADRSGTVIDPIGGLPDVLARRIRFVGDPDQRIQEDYLRILRFFRLHAVYGDLSLGIDAEGLAACSANIAGLETLSKERIGAEMRKLLSAPDPVQTVASMAQTGVLATILPGADARWLGPLHHFEAGIPPNWLRRLAAIGGTDPDENLRLSRAEGRDLDELKRYIGTPHSTAALGWLLGHKAVDVVLLRSAMFETVLPPQWRDEIARGTSARLPVTASDLMPELTGKALGERLRQIENRWLASDLRLERAQLLA